MQKRALVVGLGIAGMSAAIGLRQLSYFEANASARFRLLCTSVLTPFLTTTPRPFPAGPRQETGERETT
ncbi:hypothetical protein [Actinoallomurus iriomotensis]|uniref:Uncharacterized protein n=1 Tax=Actinoallomurus iriomotensis TaxID=478107 RepID=A0A9W6SCW6_9ACTN|nr:hypothetical protein [Actinoallomurus iriomotensis]GLY92531.1 hypothetical protein Airi02_104590 [Actinoallomurus iriomotensis]